MAGSAADFLEQDVLKYYLQAAGAVIPANSFVGLSTTTIADDGSNITEPVGGSYARVSYARTVPNWTDNAETGVGPRSFENANDVAFAQATANWNVVTDWFIATTVGGSDILFYGTLDAARNILTNDTFKILAGNLTITAD